MSNQPQLFQTVCPKCFGIVWGKPGVNSTEAILSTHQCAVTPIHGFGEIKEKKIDDGGPAYPQSVELYGGFSVRLQIAAMAMQGLLANPNCEMNPLDLAEFALKNADAMIKKSKES